MIPAIALAERPTVGRGLDDTLVLPTRPPVVVGYLRSLHWSEQQWQTWERRLREAAFELGFNLTEIITSRDVSSLTDGCPRINQILDIIRLGQAHGVLTLADYSFAWDREIVRRTVARIRQAGGFVEYVYGRASLLL